MKIKGLMLKNVATEFDALLGESITDLRKRNIDESVIQEKIDSTMEQLIDFYDEKVTDFYLNIVTEKYPEFFKLFIKNQGVISEQNEKLFALFYGYIKSGFEVYENIREHTKNIQIEGSDTIIIPSYGYLLRLADQIYMMLVNGYPDGAIRIWRSLHEYAAVLLLFLKNTDNDELPKKYIDHLHRNKNKKIESLKKHHQDLKFLLPPDDLLKHHEERISEITNRFGGDFLDEDFSWATEVFPGKKRVTFRDIERYAGTGRLRPYYIWACEYTHPGFSSLLEFMEDNRLMIAKVIRQDPTQHGLIDPMQLTLGELHEVNSLFLHRYSPDEEYQINLLMFRKMYQTLVSSFEKTKE